MEADRALLDREAHLRAFFDAGAHIVKWNLGAERSFGIPREGWPY
ncbi:MAG: hypothetical protein NTV14_06395 [Coprothermobacterota bacterium]|nr:hypothetical protein [Coprothermobacterota bacterium]